MFIWLCVRWWYGAGWAYAWRRGVVERLEWCESTFSMSTLVRTLFSPFKQTYVGRVRGSIGVHVRAAVDSLVSRVIGFLVRSVLLLAGTVCSLFVLLSGLAFLFLWAFFPALPIISVVLFASGAGV